MAYDKTQQIRINNGQCKDCGVVRGETGTTILCRVCAQKGLERSRIRIKNKRERRKSDLSLCQTCGFHNENCKYKSCEKCRTRASRNSKLNFDRIRKKKIETKTCFGCSQTAMNNYCKSCWLKSLLRKHKINTNLWEIFWQKLEDQKFKCFYTGIEIIPEENASLDHVTPKVKGGTNDLSNLVWCDRKINSFKNDNDYQSLMKICQLILQENEKRKEILNS